MWRSLAARSGLRSTYPVLSTACARQCSISAAAGAVFFRKTAIQCQVRAGSHALSTIRANSSLSSNAELEERIHKLTSTCEALASQVKHQTQLLQAQDEKLECLMRQLKRGGGNLLEVQAAKTGVVPCRDEFVPTLDMVRDQVSHTCQLDNDTLASLAISGDGFARRERLIREIMQVEQCSWDDAHEKLIEMDVINEKYYWLETMPYRIGISLAFVGCVGSILLVFCKPTAYWYGVSIAGEELPEGTEDISAMTTNQVGTWTWAWMEPMIGVASFVLLCLQFTRAQMIKMNMSPYTGCMLRNRAQRIVHEYPQYQASMVRAWAVQMPQVNRTFFPKWKRNLYSKENRKCNYRLGI